jgi:hypothetical protein
VKHSYRFHLRITEIALLVSVIVVTVAKILKTTNVVLKAFSPLIYRKPLHLYIPIYLIGLQQVGGLLLLHICIRNCRID